jgi:cell division inhibitor SepF
MSNSLNRAMDFLGLGGRDAGLPSAPAPAAAPRAVGNFTRSITPVRSARRAGEINEIVTFQPKSWEDSIVIAATFREGTPVIVNIADLTALDQRRMVDFLLGVKHGLDGNIKRVTKTVFLLSPTHVVVADEDEPEVTGMENSDDLDIRRPY